RSAFGIVLYAQEKSAQCPVNQKFYRPDLSWRPSHETGKKGAGPGRFMLEPIMYASIGFLAAGLLLVAFAPLIHERAVRLTVRRLQAATPPSFVELQIEKDLLRAEFAMSLRRLEVSLEQTKKKEVERLCELATKTAEIRQLKSELDKA